MKREAPEISIIIPVYNGEKTIAKCLESLASQKTKRNYEIIAVDDGSADNTKKIIKKMKKVRLMEQEHKGPAAARNLGAKSAKGDILLFTDSDCIPEKDWAEKMSVPFEKKEISGVQGSYKTKQRSLIARFCQLEIEERYERMRSKKYIDFIGSYSAGYRKNVFLKAGGFDESFPVASGEDPELSFKLSESGHKMCFMPEAVVYHKHPDSITKYMKQKFWRAYWRNLLYKKHPRKAASESYTPQMLKFQIVLTYLFPISVIAYMAGFGIILPVSIAVIMLITAIPLLLKNLKKDFSVGVATPPIVILRAISFSLGLIYGFFRLML
jgi:glycosyltransferase involved in cell wall biosynthesis